MSVEYSWFYEWILYAFLCHTSRFILNEDEMTREDETCVNIFIENATFYGDIIHANLPYKLDEL